MKKITLALAALVIAAACGANAGNQTTPQEKQTSMEKTGEKGTIVDFETTLGPVKVLLYDDTPKHRDNFIKLAEEGYYDGVLFHRVIKDFMVQTGDPESKDAKPGQMLGSGSPDYTIEAEIVYPKHYHKYGALAAARTGDQVNPERRSSGSQFYIVTGRKVSAAEMSRIKQSVVNSQLQNYFQGLVRAHKEEIETLQRADDREGLEALRQKLIAQTESECHPDTISPEMEKVYMEQGGTPHLDGQYTVFGEVLSGMETVEKIQAVETGAADRPKEDVRILSVKVEK